MDLIPGRQPIITLKKKVELPFSMRRPSLSSVVIKSVRKAQIQEAVAAYVTQLRAEHPEIKRVIWFGSWTTGLPTPGSDVDICLILSASDKSPRDRISDYLPFGFPVGVDLFAYTEAEFERLKHASPGWYKAITSGLEI